MFDHSDVGAVKAGEFGQGFLREVAFGAELSDPFTELVDEVLVGHSQKASGTDDQRLPPRLPTNCVGIHPSYPGGEPKRPDLGRELKGIRIVCRRSTDNKYRASGQRRLPRLFHRSHLLTSMIQYDGRILSAH